MLSSFLAKARNILYTDSQAAPGVFAPKHFLIAQDRGTFGTVKCCIVTIRNIDVYIMTVAD